MYFVCVCDIEWKTCTSLFFLLSPSLLFCQSLIPPMKNEEERMRFGEWEAAKDKKLSWYTNTEKVAEKEESELNNKKDVKSFYFSLFLHQRLFQTRMLLREFVNFLWVKFSRVFVSVTNVNWRSKKFLFKQNLFLFSKMMQLAQQPCCSCQHCHPQISGK